MKKPDIVSALEPVINCFENLGVPYLVGGSVAGSVHGIARTTIDVDLVADLGQHHIKPLVKALKSGFYITPKAIEEAIRNNTSFNLIHLESMIKIDVFILKEQPFDLTAFERKKQEELDEDSNRKYYISSAEDIILSKIRWYDSDGRVSDQQWKDILGIIKVQHKNLDFNYLKQWATKLKLLPLLEKSFTDAGFTG